MSANSRLPIMAATVVALAAMLVIVGLAAIGGVAQDTTTAGLVSVGELATEACRLTGAVPDLTPEQSTNADVLVAAAMATSAESSVATRTALTAAITLSGLHNLDDTEEASLGLFSQSASSGWGSTAELMDPAYVSVEFIRHLLSLPGWRSMEPWQAAAAVIGAATSSAYEKNWARAGQILRKVIENANVPGSCGQGGGVVTGQASAHGLPSTYAIPVGTPAEHAEVVRFALLQLGKPYVWGAAGPDAYDCSGLTMAAWASVGVQLAHYTGDQQREGAAVSPDELTPGDLVLTPGSDSPGPGIAGHVGIYLGAALVVSAIDQEYGVAVQTWDTFVSGGLVALRDPAPGR